MAVFWERGNSLSCRHGRSGIDGSAGRVCDRNSIADVLGRLVVSYCDRLNRRGLAIDGVCELRTGLAAVGAALELKRVWRRPTCRASGGDRRRGAISGDRDAAGLQRAGGGER